VKVALEKQKKIEEEKRRKEEKELMQQVLDKLNLDNHALS